MTVDKTIQFIELLLIIITFVYNNKIDQLNQKKNITIMLNMSVIITIIVMTDKRCI